MVQRNGILVLLLLLLLLMLLGLLLRLLWLLLLLLLRIVSLLAHGCGMVLCCALTLLELLESVLQNRLSIILDIMRIGLRVVHAPIQHRLLRCEGLGLR